MLIFGTYLFLSNWVHLGFSVVLYSGPDRDGSCSQVVSQIPLSHLELHVYKTTALCPIPPVPQPFTPAAVVNVGQGSPLARTIVYYPM